MFAHGNLSGEVTACLIDHLLGHGFGGGALLAKAGEDFREGVIFQLDGHKVAGAAGMGCGFNAQAVCFPAQFSRDDFDLALGDVPRQSGDQRAGETLSGLPRFQQFQRL